MEKIWYSRTGHVTIKYSACALRYWIPKATDTHSEYVILIAFPLQWLHERPSMLRQKHNACRVRFTPSNAWVQ